MVEWNGVGMPKLTGKVKVIQELQTLCNIGPKMAEKLYMLGVKTPEQMKSSNPERLFEKLKRIYKKVDPCELYVFRGAILDIPWWECKDVKIGVVNKRSKERCLKQKN